MIVAKDSIVASICGMVYSHRMEQDIPHSSDALCLKGAVGRRFSPLNKGLP